MREYEPSGGEVAMRRQQKSLNGVALHCDTLLEPFKELEAVVVHDERLRRPRDGVVVLEQSEALSGPRDFLVVSFEDFERIVQAGLADSVQSDAVQDFGRSQFGLKLAVEEFPVGTSCKITYYRQINPIFFISYTEGSSWSFLNLV